MAIATHYEVDHSCGHTETHDLSSLAAGKRAGRAAWLATTPCFEDFKKSGAAKGKKRSDEARAAERAAAEDRVEALGLPPLDGTVAQSEFATRMRDKMIHDAYDGVQSGELTEAEFTDTIVVPARVIDRARWWLDNKDVPAADLAELLADAGLDETSRTSDNPY